MCCVLLPAFKVRFSSQPRAAKKPREKAKKPRGPKLGASSHPTLGLTNLKQATYPARRLRVATPPERTAPTSIRRFNNLSATSANTNQSRVSPNSPTDSPSPPPINPCRISGNLCNRRISLIQARRQGAPSPSDTKQTHHAIQSAVQAGILKPDNRANQTNPPARPAPKPRPTGISPARAKGEKYQTNPAGRPTPLSGATAQPIIGSTAQRFHESRDTKHETRATARHKLGKYF